MNKADHCNSYYAASANTTLAFPQLSAAIESDVCVIGGGLTGLSAALHLAERGYRVVLLESACIGWGASGRNGGQIHPGYASGMSLLKQMLGRAEARKLWDLSLQAIDLLKQRIDRHHIDCDLKFGLMVAAVKQRQQPELLAWKTELEQDYDSQGLQWLEGTALREVLNSPRYCAALVDPHGGHLHPLNYTLGLAQAAASAGVEIYENTAAQKLDTGSHPLVYTANGRVHCQSVMLCGNAYLGGFMPDIRRMIMPVGTYIAATEPLGENAARALISNDAAVADMNFVLDYYRLSADQRLLFGGRVSYSTLPPPQLGATMRRRMLNIFPQLQNVRIDYAWGGFVAITMNRAPHFGRLGEHKNLYFAHGFSGQGVALSGLAGKLMAEAVAGDAERFDLFTRIKHRPFPGGPSLRTPLLVLAMLHYRLRDWL